MKQLVDPLLHALVALAAVGLSLRWPWTAPLVWGVLGYAREWEDARWQAWVEWVEDLAKRPGWLDPRVRARLRERWLNDATEAGGWAVGAGIAVGVMRCSM